MSKIVILGAGASKACPTNHPDLPMPLLRDLPSVFERFNPNTGQHEFGQKLHELLEITGSDIEVLLTLFYRLNEYFFVHSGPRYLDRPFIERVRASGSLPYYFPSVDECRQADRILEQLCSLADPRNGLSLLFAPGSSATRAPCMQLCSDASNGLMLSSPSIMTRLRTALSAGLASSRRTPFKVLDSPMSSSLNGVRRGQLLFQTVPTYHPMSTTA